MSAAVGAGPLAARLGSLLGAEAVDRAAPGPGRAPLVRASPGSLEQLVEVVRLAAADGLSLVPCGLGSKLGWTAAPRRADLLVSTRRLSGLVRHEPADGTLSALAGTTMRALRAAAREGGHFLTPDVAAPERATLGGTVAAGASGPDRLRFGPTRHHVLGTRVVLADGRVAKSGGQLVKNVTGFDLHRLYTGSHGTLCVIVEVALRLFPAPEHEVLVSAGAPDASVALQLAGAALALAARPVSLTLARVDPPIRGTAWALFARLFGKREAVEAELALLRGAWPACAVLEGAEALAEARRLRDEGFEAGASPWLRCTCLPSLVGRALAALDRRIDETGLHARVLAHPGVAVVDAQLADGVDVERAATLVRGWRDELRPLGGRVELRDASPDLLALVSPWGGEPRGLAWMRRLKDALDPGEVFAAGRLAGGL